MESNIKLTTTKNKIEVELKSFITMEDEEFIQDAFTENVNLNGVAGQKDLRYTMEASRGKIAKQRSIETVVVSIGGQTENIYDIFKKLDRDDGNEILAQIEEITGDKKKESSTSAT